jgi:hypothetical protein
MITHRLGLAETDHYCLSLRAPFFLSLRALPFFVIARLLLFVIARHDSAEAISLVRLQVPKSKGQILRLLTTDSCLLSTSFPNVIIKPQR